MGYAYILEPYLAQGSRPPLYKPLRPQFTTLVLCAKELVLETPYGDPRAFNDVKIIYAPIDDAKPTKEELKIAIITACNVARLINRHERVLVTCNMGRNRSGLVVALAMCELGYSAKQSITHIQDVRANALTNHHFVKAIRAYEHYPRLHNRFRATLSL